MDYKISIVILLFFLSCTQPCHDSVTKNRQSTNNINQPYVVTLSEPTNTQNYIFITPLEQNEELKIKARVDVFYKEVKKALSPEHAEKEPVTIEILPNEKQFSEKTEKEKPEVLDKNSALYPAKRLILVYLNDEDAEPLLRAIFRNQTRLFIYKLTDKFPLWIEEGIVSFFEETVISDTGYRITGYSADKLEKLQTLIKTNACPHFEELVKITERSDFKEAHELVSWGFTYWAQMGSQSSSRIKIYKSYLRAILEKGAKNVNLEDYTKISMEEFENKWADWILKQEVFK
ncbi:MAG: hypothetical protein ABIH42_08110 [Planctomycetota bacterium]